MSHQPPSTERAPAPAQPVHTPSPSASPAPSLPTALVATAARDDDEPDVPPALLCPICRDLLFEPVVAACAHAFDLQCILRWHDVAAAQGRDVACPTCRAPLEGVEEMRACDALGAALKLAAPCAYLRRLRERSEELKMAAELCTAVCTGDAAAVEDLLGARGVGAREVLSATERHTRHKPPLLHEAVLNDDVPVARALLQLGHADPLARYDDDGTALSAARSPDMIQLLFGAMRRARAHERAGGDGSDAEGEDEDVLDAEVLQAAIEACQAHLDVLGTDRSRCRCRSVAEERASCALGGGAAGAEAEDAPNEAELPSVGMEDCPHACVLDALLGHTGVLTRLRDLNDLMALFSCPASLAVVRARCAAMSSAAGRHPGVGIVQLLENVLEEEEEGEVFWCLAAAGDLFAAEQEVLVHVIFELAPRALEEHSEARPPALHSAVLWGRWRLARALLGAGVEVDATCGRTESVSLSISLADDAEQGDVELEMQGFSALHAAVLHERAMSALRVPRTRAQVRGLVTMLLEHRADPLRPSGGCSTTSPLCLALELATPLALGALLARSEPCREVLASNRPDPSTRSLAVMTAVLPTSRMPGRAQGEERALAMRLLLDARADPSATPFPTAEPPISHAASSADDRAVAELLQASAHPCERAAPEGDGGLHRSRFGLEDCVLSQEGPEVQKDIDARSRTVRLLAKATVERCAPPLPPSPPSAHQTRAVAAAAAADAADAADAPAEPWDSITRPPRLDAPDVSRDEAGALVIRRVFEYAAERSIVTASAEHEAAEAALRAERWQARRERERAGRLAGVSPGPAGTDDEADDGDDDGRACSTRAERVQSRASLCWAQLALSVVEGVALGASERAGPRQSGRSDDAAERSAELCRAWLGPRALALAAASGSGPLTRAVLSATRPSRRTLDARVVVLDATFPVAALVRFGGPAHEEPRLSVASEPLTLACMAKSSCAALALLAAGASPNVGGEGGGGGEGGAEALPAVRLSQLAEPYEQQAGPTPLIAAMSQPRAGAAHTMVEHLLRAGAEPLLPGVPLRPLATMLGEARARSRCKKPYDLPDSPRGARELRGWVLREDIRCRPDELFSPDLSAALPPPAVAVRAVQAEGALGGRESHALRLLKALATAPPRARQRAEDGLSRFRTWWAELARAGGVRWGGGPGAEPPADDPESAWAPLMARALLWDQRQSGADAKAKRSAVREARAELQATIAACEAALLGLTAACAPAQPSPSAADAPDAAAAAAPLGLRSAAARGTGQSGAQPYPSHGPRKRRRSEGGTPRTRAAARSAELSTPAPEGEAPGAEAESADAAATGRAAAGRATAGSSAEPRDGAEPCAPCQAAADAKMGRHGERSSSSPASGAENWRTPGAPPSSRATQRVPAHSASSGCATCQRAHAVLAQLRWLKAMASAMEVPH